jgi:hypothetical protein
MDVSADMLITVMLNVDYTKCRYAECHYAAMPSGIRYLCR